ncbi:S9 family peptidase [Boudabousia marimammalium]|uniref:Oligopeptidase B n=1 Tax=Boudabousia marimammalium TaxID=156892 RepID=A0A1Q5PSN3_9ACTO|nr:S9 family peptidase [Boudabousia marimammalium]OKL50594.1 hypothetical protein BM477_01130 [Boudabousia marimammalium]
MSELLNPDTAPVPDARPIERTFHGDTFVDRWDWLRDKTNPEAIAHLEAENAWTRARMAHTAQLQADLVEEYRSHTQLDDVSVPERVRNWWYYKAVDAKHDYPRYYRVPANPEDIYEDAPTVDPVTGEVEGAAAALLLDVNLLAAGHEFTNVENAEISPNDRYFTYGVDHTGDERFTQYILDTASGQVIDQIEDVVYSVAWSAASNCLYYVRADESWRACEVWVHRIGQPAETDTLVLREDDEIFEVGIGGSRDGNWVIIAAYSTNTTEFWLVDAHALAGSPEAHPTSVAGRRPGLRYQVEPAGDHLLVVHDLHHADSELAMAPLPIPGVAGRPESWQSLRVPAEGERILSVSAYAMHAVLELRSEGMAAVEYLVPDPDHGWVVEGRARLGREVETVESVDSDWWFSPKIRFVSESLMTPPTLAEVDCSHGEVKVLKTQNVPNFDASLYEEWREWATAEDGTKIPMTLARRKDVPADGTAPGLIWGYGSYEISVDPRFRTNAVSLLDRGVVFAFAHIRGGGELGRNWYLQGRTNQKINTFTDFVACSKHLIDSGLVAADRLAAQGGSAGGLLMGAVANLAPELYRVILAHVPFVDALTTILNPDLPLTAGEWEEWGNPIKDPEIYRYMKSYSPYENVREGVQYPAILATTSLNDTRVFYVEPAKWVARLREAATNDPVTRPILLHCEMVAGHGGVTGREAKWAEIARDYAFALDQLSATELLEGK